jgi:glucose/arabinose dehydrogenase
VYNGGITGTITKITPAGVGSVFATGFSNPQGLAFDAQGSLYVANTGYITKITPDGASTLFAQNGLNGPVGLCFDYADNLYVADANNNTIMRFSQDGVGSVVVSTGLNDPIGIAIQVPEPSTWAIFSLGIAALSYRCSRKHGLA